MKLLTQFSVLAILLLSVASHAHADTELSGNAEEGYSDAEMLRSGTKASSIGVGLGAVVSLSGSGTVFDLHLNYSYHFSGDGSGFALGGDFDIVTNAGNGVFIIPGVRGTYDFEVSNGIYLSPFTSLGLIIATEGGVGFNTRLGLAVKVLLNDLFFASVQPLGIDISIGSGGTAVSYDLVFGGGFTF